MTETQPEQPAAAPAEPPAAPDHEGSLETRMDRLEAALNQLLHRGGDGAAADEGDRSIAAEVQAEVRKLKAAEDRKKKADEQAGKVGQLEATVKKLAERKPREYRKITRLMGWVTDEDDGK